MSIQSNINQTLNLASLLIGSNESVQAAAKKRRDIKRLETKAAVENEQYQVLKSGLSNVLESDLPQKTDAAHEIALDMEALGKRSIATEEELFEADPSTERYMGLIYARGMSKEISSINRKYETRKAAEEQAAEEASRTEIERIRKSRAFTKMITEGVPNLSFNPDEYVPPERKEK